MRASSGRSTPSSPAPWIGSGAATRWPDATRVTAGEARGGSLVAPRGGRPRAAPDRTRETLFAILEPELGGARVLDLFAGAGALGMGALSRGAAAVTFVERDAEAVRALRKNLETTGFGSRATVVGADVIGFLGARHGGQFDLVLCDPPFADVATAEATLAHSGLRAALARDGLLVARAHRKHLLAAPPDARVVREKRIGEERLLFLRYGLRAEDADG